MNARLNVHRSPPPGNASLHKLVMVIDDTPEVRELVGDVLEDRGYTTVRKSDGVSALEYLRTGPLPEVILLDLVMGGMNGSEFREEQLSDPRICGIPVVLMTGLRAINGKSLGLNQVLTKPFHVKDLIAAVERARV